jgi:hypothetical protein
MAAEAVQKHRSTRLVQGSCCHRLLSSRDRHFKVMQSSGPLKSPSKEDTEFAQTVCALQVIQGGCGHRLLAPQDCHLEII